MVTAPAYRTLLKAIELKSFAGEGEWLVVLFACEWRDVVGSMWYLQFQWLRKGQHVWVGAFMVSAVGQIIQFRHVITADTV